MLNNIKGAIFDLDGVIVNTAKYHYLAWSRLAKELGFEFSETDNEKLKGVSRMKSLELLLEIGNIVVSEEEKLKLAEKKNAWYVNYVSNIDERELLCGAKELILQLKNAGIKIALGSASKNAPLIIHNLGIESLFDCIIDGNKVSRAKPDPEVFILAAAEMRLASNECVVFEDAKAGVEAAKRAGMKCIGIGNSSILKTADLVINGLYELLVVLKKLKEALLKNNIYFEFIHYDKQIRTAQEGADYLNIQIAQTAPTLILYTSNGYYALVISGARDHVALKSIKKLLNCNNVRLATKGEVDQVTGFTVGNVPMLGLRLPYIVDEQLFKYPFIYGGTGEPNITLKVSPDALIKLNSNYLIIKIDK